MGVGGGVIEASSSGKRRGKPGKGLTVGLEAVTASPHVWLLVRDIDRPHPLFLHLHKLQWLGEVRRRRVETAGVEVRAE